MASTTVHNFPSDGSSTARGLASVADGDTVSTDLTQVDWFLAGALSDDVVVSFTSASAGVVTVAVYVAGVASVGTQTIYWRAHSNQKI